MHRPSQRVVAVKLLQNEWFGTLRVEAEPSGVCAINWAGDATVSQAVHGADDTPADDASAEHWAHLAVQQLEEYFAGERKQLKFLGPSRDPVSGVGMEAVVADSLRGNPVLRRYCAGHRKGPGGSRCRAGQPGQSDSGHHSVPPSGGSNGTLTGYAGDQVHLKQHLLEHEHAVLPVKSTRQPRIVEPKTVILPLV